MNDDSDSDDESKDNTDSMKTDDRKVGNYDNKNAEKLKDGGR